LGIPNTASFSQEVCRELTFAATGMFLNPDLLLDSVANLFGPAFERLGVAAFDEEAGFGFGAGIALQLASALG
jgi:hypothetical protein